MQDWNPTGEDGTTLVIDCGTCEFEGSHACADCVVTFICERDRARPVVIGIDEARAVSRLAGAGLVPGLRHRTRAG